MKTVEQVLLRQRQHQFLPIQKLQHFLYGLQNAAQFLKILKQGPQVPHNFNIYNKGRLELIKDAYQKLPHYFNYNQMTFDNENQLVYLFLSSQHQIPGTAHFAMFIKCIELMGSEQQKNKYIKKSRTFDIVGCYAQTELGHGSDIKNLETTATYQKDTGDFIIDTPNISAAKYWPGELGLLATHALVFAQLIVQNQNYGVHPFIVQIRDQNFKCLPGIQAGDIGPKIGFLTKQNGYLLMHQIKVSKSDLLSQFITINKDASVSVHGNPQLAYATMMFVRQFISVSCPKVYSQAITIAVRYSLFRRQFKDHHNLQIPIINYQSQKNKIIPRIAEYYAIATNGLVIAEMCKKNAQMISRGDLSYTPQTHIVLCGSKALFSEIVYEGMQICRKACGGAGYSHYSGFPSIIFQYAANNTHEGQNTVLYLQIANFILKNHRRQIKEKTIPENVSYLASFNFYCQKNSNIVQQQYTLENVRILLIQSICHLLNCITKKITNRKDKSMNEKDFVNTFAGNLMQQMAIMHSYYYTYKIFYENIFKENNESIKSALSNLCLIFGIDCILKHSSPLIQGQFVSASDFSLLSTQKQELFQKIRPNIITLVDAFGIPDSLLRSELVRGNPYQNYLNLARKNQINHQSLESAKVVRQIKNYLTLDPKL